jgi:disease resistance protein RPM1
MEEAPVVVTAATGALGPVVANLSTLLRRDGEYKLRRGTRKDIKLIRSKLKSIHSILWVIWEREDLDAEGKELRMEAWRLADDMNDAIDDFILSLKRSNDGRRFNQAKIQPSRPFKDLKRRADGVSERCRKKWKMETSLATTFSSLFSTTKTTVGDSGPGKRTRIVDPYVHKDISKLVGMEEPRDKLIKHLVGEEEVTLQAQLKMASILGAAGVGKTTLARHVYEAIDKDKFKARAFVSILSCHNMTEVLASILRQVAADDSTAVLLAGIKAATEKHLIGIISNFLKDKRCACLHLLHSNVYIQMLLQS